MSTDLVIQGPAALTTEEKALALEHIKVQLELCISLALSRKLLHMPCFIPPKSRSELQGNFNLLQE